MRVHVLHHGLCFDGAASAAIFAAMYRACVAPEARFVFRPKVHRLGDPFEPDDFAADDSAIVDFRYSTDSRLGWYFDHHQSAFQLAGEREHFEARRGQQRFHDPEAPCCTSYIARITQDTLGFDPSPHEELLHWAEIIDTAAFPGPEMPVELGTPALQVMTFAEHNRNLALVSRFVDDLGARRLADIASESYIQDLVQPTLAQHREDIELMRARCTVRGGVAEYDLSDQPPRSYNKFIAYYLHPTVRYLVGVSKGPDGALKLSAGYNPWLPADAREHDIAALCERLGGGGHPFVGGVSFSGEQPKTAADAKCYIAAILRGDRPLPGAVEALTTHEHPRVTTRSGR